MIATFAPVTTLVRRLRAVLWLGLALATGPLYAQATIAVTSDSLEFPAIAIGDTTVDSLYVINTNTVENLTVDTLSLIHGTVFAVDTTYSVILPEESLKVHITYTPSAFGSDVDSLLIISNAANAETLYVYLTGSSPQPTIIASRDSVIFPAIALDSSWVDSLFIRNTGTLNVLTVDTLFLEHGTVFALDTTSGEIPAGDSLKVRVTYSPDTLGTDIDSLLIVCNAANAETLSVYLFGSSPLPAIAASRDSVIFPAIVVDSSKADSLFIRNTGTPNILTVDTLSLVHGTVFALDTTSGEIPAGDSLKVRVTYSPSAFGTDVDSLLIISNAANAETLYVCLAGSSPPPVIVLRADSLQYDKTKILNTSVKTLMVVNMGTTNTLTIDTVYSATGAFLSSPDSGMVSPGDSLALSVSFKPTKLDFFNDSLTIVSNDPDHPEVKVFVSGQSAMGHRPGQNAVAAAPDSAIYVTFGTPMHPPSIDSTTFLVNAARTGRVNGSFDYDIGSHTSIFTPAEPFEYGDLVTVTLTTGIQDLMRDPLPEPYTWSFTAGVHAGSGDYNKTASPGVGNNPHYMTTGDWDGDGDLDLAVANYSSNTVSILTGDGSGAFSQTSTPGVGSNPMSVTTGDWDNDGDLDLAVVNYSSNTLSILTGDGSGAFSQTSTPGVGSGPYFVSAGDLDSDGDLDLAVANYGSNTVSILTGDGSGAFSQTSTPGVGSNPMSVTTGDWDNDGDLDLAVANRGSNTLSILTGDGSGAFSQTSTPGVGSGPYFVSAGDLDSDGDLDLAVVNYYSNTVSILTGDGSGAFSQTSAPGVGTYPMSVTTGDWDNDGDLDLAVGVWNSARVTILSNNGSGSFTNTKNISSGYYVRSVVHGDWDGDGSLDLAASNSNHDRVSIFQNKTAINIAIAPDSLDYGIIKTNTSKELFFSISNTGQYQTLEVTNIVSSNPSFSVTPSSVSIAPNTTDSIMVTFTPIEVGVYNDTLTIYSNDPDEPEKIHLLYGTGAPAVLSTIPPANSPGADSRTIVSATFNTAIREATLNPASIHIIGDVSGECICSISYDSLSQTVVLKPDSNFIYGEQVSVILTDSIKAVNGDVALQAGYSWNFFVSPLFGTGNFELDTVGYKSGGGPFTAVPGDFNRDGFADLAAANDGDNSVSVFLNDKSRSFVAPVHYATGAAPQGIAVSDLNSDGYPDIIAANNGSDNISVLINNGDGTFAVASNYPVETNPRPLAVGDLDNDGDMDVVVANVSSNDISVLINDGAGAYAADTVITVGDAPSGIVLQDLDGDADVDIAVSNKNSNNISILLNQMPGFTTSSPHSSGSDSNPNDLVAIDLNDDGSVDLATANRTSDNIALLFNNGDATFTTPSMIPVGDQPIDLYAHDFDADGDADLAVLDYGDFDVRTFLNDGLGSFIGSDTVSVVGGPRSLTGLDISGKIGIIDLMVVDILRDSILVIKNRIKEGILATTHLRRSGEQSGNVVFDYLAYNSSSADSMGLVAEYSRSGDLAWLPASVTGDTSRLPPGINEGEFIWNSENDLPSVDLDSARFRIIAYSGPQKDTSQAIFFPLDNFHGQSVSVALTDTLSEYSDSVHIKVVLVDTTYDVLSISGFYNVAGGGDSSATLIGDLVGLDSSRYVLDVVWNSGADLPNTELDSVQLKIIPSDGWAESAADSTVVFSLDNNLPPSVAIPDFPGEQSGDVFVVYQLTDEEHDTLAIDLYYSTGSDPSWKKATVTGDTIDVVDYADTLVWHSLIDLNTIDDTTTRLLLIPRDKDAGFADTTAAFHLDNNQLPGIVLSELDGYYQGDITISYTLNDPESDPISLLVEYKQKPATSWDSASVEDDITDLTVYQDSLVWNSLSDLPDYTGQVAFRIIPLDNDPGQPDTIVFFVNQIGAPVVAVHDVLPAHNSSCCWYDKIQVTLSKSIDVSTVTPNVEVQGIHTGEVTIIPAVQDTLLFLTPDSPFTSLDSITVELKADMTDIYGLYLDGNNNGAPDGSPDDDYVWNFSVTALGDFNLDSMVDQSDLNLFRAAWFKRPQDLQYELGPFQGEIPHLRLVPDNSLDFDDLVVFAGMWNWSQANVNPVINLNTLAKANVGETLLRFEPVFLDNYMWADISERSFALELWIEEDGLPIGLGITMLLDPNVMRYKGFESSDSLGKELNGWFTLDKYYEESGLLVLNMANFSTSSNGASPPGYIGRLNAEVLQVSETAVPFKYDLWMTGADDSLYQGLTMVHISTAPPLPTEFALHQNYPNPFNPSTTIRFELPEAVDVHLMVYDILGREIVRLKNERMEAGYHQVRWNGRDGLGRFIASGIYFARMATPGYSKTVKMLLLK